MRPLVLLSSSLSLAAAACNGDNCLRAIRGTRIPTRPAEGLRDCSSYLRRTVTVSTSISTTTVSTTPTVSVTTTVFSIYGKTVVSKRQAEKRASTFAAPFRPAPTVEKRQVTFVPSRIPSYATACAGAAAYSSACSCLGVTPTVTTVASSVSFIATTVPATVNHTDVTVRTATVCIPPSYGAIHNGGGYFPQAPDFYARAEQHPEVTDYAGCCALCFNTHGCYTFYVLPGNICNLDITTAGTVADPPLQCPNGIVTIQPGFPGNYYGGGPCAIEG